MVGSLIKGVLVLTVSGIAAYGVIQMSNLSGNVKINFNNYEISISFLTGFLTLLVVFSFIWLIIIIFGFAVALFRFLVGDETAIKRYFERSRQLKGYNELSNALVSLYEGNKGAALFHSNRAKKLLNNDKLSILINTQIAHQSGDGKLALENYKILLHRPETKIVALTGIISEKIKNGDISEALELAKRSFELSPKNINGVVTLFNLQIQENDWLGAKKTLQVKRKLQKIPREEFLRHEAILIFADAREKRALGHTKEALNATLIAVRQYPDFVAALVFLAELEVLSGNKKRIEKFLKKAWELFPHPEIAKAYASLVPDESPAQRLKRFEAFRKISPDDVQTAILVAELCMAAGNFPAAKEAIEKTAKNNPDNRVLTLMAVIERSCGATDEIIRGWLTKAVYAPKAPDWICKICGDQTPWNPMCKNCGEFDTIRWKRPAPFKETIDRKKLLPLLSGSTEATTNENQSIDLEFKSGEGQVEAGENDDVKESTNKFKKVDK